MTTATASRSIGKAVLLVIQFLLSFCSVIEVK
jgi:hypothetical protein